MALFTFLDGLGPIRICEEVIRNLSHGAYGLQRSRRFWFPGQGTEMG